jgi:hypothetical protein
MCLLIYEYYNWSIQNKLSSYVDYQILLFSLFLFICPFYEARKNEIFLDLFTVGYSRVSIVKPEELIWKLEQEIMLLAS